MTADSAPLPRELLDAHHVFVASDNPFQQRARLLQALWREERGLAIGFHRGRKLGSLLEMPDAELRLTNFISENVRDVVRREVLDPAQARGRLYDRPRIFENLLSSQPLAFNLFAELSVDLDLATRIFRRLWPERVAEVTKIGFEHSPGRGDERYTHDHTAFDVFAEHTTPRGGRGFIGIEVKYHEGLTGEPARHRPRYEEVTRAMGCFKPDRVEDLRRVPVEQIWRDHMLAGSMLLRPSAWETGLYVFLYPEGNVACGAAVQLYRDLLHDESTFAAVTLERVIDAIRQEHDGAWGRQVESRYLGWEKIARAQED